MWVGEGQGLESEDVREKEVDAVRDNDCLRGTPVRTYVVVGDVDAIGSGLAFRVETDSESENGEVGKTLDLRSLQVSGNLDLNLAGLLCMIFKGVLE